MSSTKDPRLARAGVSGYNKPKATPSHPTKSHVVVAKSGSQVKTIRFGQQGVKGSPKTDGESEANKNYALQVIFNASIFCIIKTYTTVKPCETMTTH